MPKNKQQQKEKGKKKRKKEKKKAFQADGWGCFNQSFNIFTGESRNCQETNVKKEEEKKSLTTAWSFSICGHESRWFVSLVVAMSREELCV